MSTVTQTELNAKFDTLKEVLKGVKGSKGNDLHSHLQAVMKKLILHYPNNPLDKLEEVSYLIKNEDTLNMEDFLKVEDFRSYKQVCGLMQDYITQMKKQFP